MEKNKESAEHSRVVDRAAPYDPRVKLNRTDFVQAIRENHDVVERPSHYQGITIDGVHIQVVDVIETFCHGDEHLAHVMTYLLRAGKKEGNPEIQDLKKAIWWIERKIKFLKARGEGE